MEKKKKKKTTKKKKGQQQKKKKKKKHKNTVYIWIPWNSSVLNAATDQMCKHRLP